MNPAAAPRRVLIAAGGTGGHMFPARAAAETLAKRGWRVMLVTDARGARHAQDFPAEEIAEINAATPFVKNPVTMAKNLLKIRRGIGDAREILREYRPDAVAGFGGYPAFPVLLAARGMKIPFIIHEQNAVLGRVNRFFAAGAFKVASGFERLDRVSPSAERLVSGNPVRAAVLEAAAAPYAPPSPDGPLRLLVIGGSLGARILSVTVPKAVAVLPEDLRKRLSVVQQTRAENLEEARAIYKAAGVEAVCEPFFDDMGARYAAAHLVVSRAGASTVAELSAIGRPAILVPFAAAMDDHQTANAADLNAAGAAVVMPESGLAPDTLSAELESLLRDGEALRVRAEAARRCGRPEAHAVLADLVEQAASA